MQQYDKSLFSAVLEITNRCNLRCPHCASDSGCAREDEMSLDEMKRVVADLRILGCREFTMLGGEFLLRPDWYEIAKAVKSEDMELQLITNGLLVSPETRKLFKSLDPQTVGVSIDGATPESYIAVRGVDGFGKCRQLLNDLASDGFRQVSAITTFNAKNLGDFDRFVEMFIDTEIVWQVQMAHKGGERFPEDLLMSRSHYEWFSSKVTDALYDLHGRLKIQVMDDFGYFPMTPKLRFICQRWGGCQAGQSVIGIRANGDVLPCLSLGGQFVEANLRKRPLVDIWRDPDSFSKFRNKSLQLTGKCAKCPFGEKCKAGCSAMALSQTGTLTETTFCVRQLEQERILKDLFTEEISDERTDCQMTKSVDWADLVNLRKDRPLELYGCVPYVPYRRRGYIGCVIKVLLLISIFGILWWLLAMIF